MLILILVILILVVGGVAFLLISAGTDKLDEPLRLFSEKKYNEALPLFKEEVLKDDSSIRAQYYLARCYEAMGDIDKALFHYSETKKIGTFGLEVDRLEVYKKVADIHYSRGMFEAALESFLEVLQVYPDDLHSNAHVAFIALGQGEFTVADSYIDKCARMKPDEKSYQVAQLVTQFELGNETEAFTVIERLLQKEPGDLDLNIMFIVMCQNSHFRDGIDKIKNFYSKVTSDHLKVLLIRLMVYLAYKDNLAHEAIQFLQGRLAGGDNLEALKVEALYFLVFFELKKENYNDAEEHLANLNKMKSNFRGVNKVELYIKMRNIGYQSSEFEAFDVAYENAFRDLIPGRLLFKISGMQVKEKVNLEKFWDFSSEHPQLVAEFAPVTLESAFQIYGELGPEAFIEYAQKAALYLGYKPGESMPAGETGGVDLVGRQIRQGNIKALLAFRRYGEDANVSDIFLENIASKVNDLKLDKAIVISNATMTDGAKTKLAELGNIEVLGESQLLDMFKAAVPRAEPVTSV